MNTTMHLLLSTTFAAFFATGCLLQPADSFDEAEFDSLAAGLGEEQSECETQGLFEQDSTQKPDPTPWMRGSLGLGKPDPTPWRVLSYDTAKPDPTPWDEPARPTTSVPSEGPQDSVKPDPTPWNWR